jgi:hypothetical protein
MAKIISKNKGQVFLSYLFSFRGWPPQKVDYAALGFAV